jgi:hypothetical protein
VWIPHHAGAELPNGKGKVVAPSSLSGTLLCHRGAKSEEVAAKPGGPNCCWQPCWSVHHLPASISVVTPPPAIAACRDHLPYQHQHEADWEVC